MALDRTWYNSLVNDDGSGLTGSVWDKEDVNQLMNAIDAELARTGSKPFCFVRRDTPQPCYGTTWDNILYWTAPFFCNPSSMWGAGLPTQITIPEAGDYLVIACVMWDINPTGIRGARVHRNGVHDTFCWDTRAPLAGTWTACHVSGIVQCNVGDALQVGAYQDSGVMLNAGGQGAWPQTSYFQVRKI